MDRTLLSSVAVGLVAAAFGCSSSAGSGSGGGSSAASGGQTGSTGGAGNGAGTSSSGGAGNLSGASNAGLGSVAGSGNGAGASNAGGANPGGPGAAGASSAGAGGGLGAFMGIDFGAVSDGGTVTYQNIGAMGSYQSVCAPTGGACCRQTKTISSDKLTPWDEELIMTLRGPLDIRQFATYQPTVEGQASPWQLVSSFDARTPATAKGIAFSGAAAKSGKAFTGTVASTCLVNASTDKDFGCGPSSSPYCSMTSSNTKSGWTGSKMFVFLASMPHVDSGGITTDQNCSPPSNGWNDAPWIGLSVGELIRAGAFSSCQCYETTPNQGDGCGQINALEVINDNDATGDYKNLEIFSSNFFSYGGDFGGPCGTNNCNTTGIPATVDLVTGKMAAPAGVTGSQTPRMNPNGFLRRPTTGYRYFILLLDVTTRTVQYAIVHPGKVPAALDSLLPNLPNQVPQSTIDSVIGLRLPK